MRKADNWVLYFFQVPEELSFLLTIPSFKYSNEQKLQKWKRHRNQQQLQQRQIKSGEYINEITKTNKGIQQMNSRKTDWRTNKQTQVYTKQYLTFKHASIDFKVKGVLCGNRMCVFNLTAKGRQTYRWTYR